MYSYDSYGWLSLADIPGRQTSVEPPTHGASPVVGQPWPNWSGVEWVMASYVESPVVTPVIIKTPMSVLDFRSRFTDAEKVAIYNAAKASVELEIWLDDLKSASEVRTDDPRTIAGVNGLEAAGLIGAGRAAQILE